MKFEQSKTIGTSLKQVPAQVKKIDWSAHVDQSVLDYGAGRYPRLVNKYLEENNIIDTVSYDPYNPDISTLVKKEFDVILCSNVLNVIGSDDMLEMVLKDISDHLAEDGVAYIQVYVGDQSGESRETPRGWQRNAAPVEYVDLLRTVFSQVKVSGNRFICQKSK
jgi:hypothetical protein